MTRLGRAVVYVHQQEDAGISGLVRSRLERLLLAGRAMDFAVRLKGHTSGVAAAGLTPAMALNFAELAGLGRLELIGSALPALKAANVVAYTVDGGELIFIEEYVGITGTVIDQTARVLQALKPSDLELAVLHSVELASYVPLTRTQHLDQLVQRGFTAQLAEEGLKLALAAGVNKEVPAPELREPVVFNPYVWGSNQVPIAGFLRSLPSAERDALLGICQQAIGRPGLALSGIVGNSALITSATKVGLIQAATVKSTAGGKQTYVFSPLLEAEDNQLVTTEALHQRKLFVAHILFGKEKARPGYGKILDPVTLVNALLRNKMVGPATNIATDYYLLEAHGVIRVEKQGSGRGLLHLVKEDIVEGGLAWLRKTQGALGDTSSLILPQSSFPQSFTSPERNRHQLPDEAAANEITVSAILRLREEAQNAARFDNIF